MTEENKHSDAEIAAFNDAHYEFFFRSRSPFSQWHPCKFTDPSGIVYKSAEQYMMYQKAMLFGDLSSAQKIASATTQKEIKDLGRAVRGFDENTWVRERERIVTRGNLLKFGQAPNLYAKLVATYPKVLVEASPYDKIWGIGLSEDIARITPDTAWPGANLLGKCLTQVRGELMLRERMSEVPAATIAHPA